MTQLSIEQAIKLANDHLAAGRLADAEPLYRQILALQPNAADVMHQMASIANQTGRPDLGIDWLRRAVAIEPGHPRYHFNLAVLLQQTGQLDEAILSYQRVILLKPQFAEAHNNLGNVRKAKGDLDQALASFTRALDIKPDYVDALVNFANTLLKRGDIDRSLDTLQRAIALDPKSISAMTSLGTAWKHKGDLRQAIAAHEAALVLNPNSPEVLSNLGIALKDIGLFDRAIECLQKAVTINPRLAEAHTNLGNAWKEVGRIDEAIECYRRVLTLNPQLVIAYDNLLGVLLFHPNVDAATLYNGFRQWNIQYAQPLAHDIRPHPNHRDPDRRLRVGFVSADFRFHPVARFLLPLLASRHRDSIDVYCYSQARIVDSMTTDLQSHAETWRDIAGLSDVELAELIRRDQIDILVDLAGHTSGNRLLALARKPAPVQVTYLGYPATTGLTAIDYRLTDALADPPGMTESLHTEQLLRLPQSAWCFQPPADAPPVGALPAIQNGFVTFGSFNNIAKINQPLLQLWAKILRCVPHSRLLLKARGLNAAAGQLLIQRIMAESGIEPGRIALFGHFAWADHLALYNRVDIALDTYPYHGTTTTCEALWMGVPVITLAGKSHVARVGVSLLSNAGLPELVASSADQYGQIAVALAGDLLKLTELRSTMRQRLIHSPLMDADRFARDVESAYRSIWRTWCQQ